MTNAYTVSGGKREGKDDLGDLNIGDNIKMYLREIKYNADR
jgi:hypothetical protein